LQLIHSALQRLAVPVVSTPDVAGTVDLALLLLPVSPVQSDIAGTTEAVACLIDCTSDNVDDSAFLQPKYALTAQDGGRCLVHFATELIYLYRQLQLLTENSVLLVD